MRGKQAHCKGCGNLLLLSGPDPLGVLDVPSIPEVSLLSAPMPAHELPGEDEIPWPTLKRIGVVGGFVLCVVIVVTTFLQYLLPLLQGKLEGR